MAALAGERAKREALEEGLEEMVAAQQELERKNRRLRARVGETELARLQVREQSQRAEAVLRRRREPTHEEIVRKISAAIGVGLIKVESEVKGTPPYYLSEYDWRQFHAGRGPAWKEEQRRRQERDKKQQASEGA